MILDKYFQRPIFWDYFLCYVFCSLSIYLVYKEKIQLPTDNDTIAITSDITNISLTLSGFILTLLTVLITFKSGSNIKKIESDSDDTVFNLFFASGYYFETVKHLKNCIKSLIFIAVIGFMIKLFLPLEYKSKAFFFNVPGLCIIILTISRCVLILNKVLELQQQEHNNNNS
ncbi:hypothetical protein K6T82_16360 [Flavobacterium sp. 17A]|uniref:Uncharacterized protein n=1 Tax=Flavobacterium potami TaxID=2872310 RepID=A0A9X1HCW9_9FLAO|nr:hypothetical protein [Flavobacterium potami]MBZ4036347.1 hypothetical protein [Flavobacterium potami]